MGIMIAAEGLGYHSVALGIIARPEVEKLFGLEKKLVIGVALGKAKEKKPDIKFVGLIMTAAVKMFVIVSFTKSHVKIKIV